MRNRLFNSIPVTRPRSNVFDLSHELKLSCNMGELIPILCQEIVPTDKFRVNTEVFIRLAPMVAPVMHRINVYVHYFFVPNRIIWDNWQNFITGGKDGLNASVHPYVKMNNTNKAYFYDGSLPDYMGCPTIDTLTPTNEIRINSLPFRAYQLIWNEYYMDQTLHTAIDINKDGDGDESDYAVLYLKSRCWEKDYFTSALTDTQRGGDVVLPGTPDYSAASHWYQDDDGQPTSGAVAIDGDTPAHLQDSGYAALRVENLDGYDIAVNDLRTATRLQEWLEKQARSGSRYIETILSHFGIYGDNAELQRPQFLGGQKVPVIISEVLNTSDTATHPQGAMTGHGISVGKANGFKKGFKEHGWLIGIMSVLPRTAYQQGLERKFFKTDKYDYYWPSFANLGEQEVFYKELYPAWTGTDNNDTAFGYQSRYAEYKFKQSSVHGDFRVDYDTWHMGRIFDSQPSLNSTFVTAIPTHRIFAVTDTSYDKVYAQIYNSISAIRPMPKFGVPKL